MDWVQNFILRPIYTFFLFFELFRPRWTSKLEKCYYDPNFFLSKKSIWVSGFYDEKVLEKTPIYKFFWVNFFSFFSTDFNGGGGGA